MLLKKVKIGGATAENNVFLAPLAGYTDFAFRGLCSKLGAGLTFTEMVSAKGLIYKNRGTRELLFTAGNEKITAVQIFGSDPEVMRAAAESDELALFDIIDINMGCPVPKIYNNGEGSALLNDLPLAEKIIAAMAKSGKNITVKIRLGTERGKPVAAEFARAAENAGAAMITVHGRYRPDYYSGEVEYGEIAAVKRAVNIPVIANGGVFTAADADKLQAETGADGVMLARGAFYNPFLFSYLTGTATELTLKDFIIKHLDMLASKFSDGYAAVNFRKIMPCYLKNVKCDKKLKVAFTACKTTAEIKALLDEVF